MTSLAISAAQLGIVQGEESDRQLDFDLGHLLAAHPSMPDNPQVSAGSVQAIHKLATLATQSLVRQIFSLPSHSIESGRVVALPRPQLCLPRSKPVPQPKPLTKWERFAKEKGITNGKRSKLVFDKHAQDWKRRHGYKRGIDEAAVPILEASKDDKGSEDPFTRLERENRNSIKQKKRGPTANHGIAAPTFAVPATVKLATKLDASATRGQIAKGKALKSDIANASHLAGVSTASMGKFDKRLKGERGERKLPGLRRKHLPVDGGDTEGGMVSKAIKKAVRHGEGDFINVRRAIGNLEAKKREGQRIGEDGDGSSKRKKGGRVKNRRVPKKMPAQQAGTAKKNQGKKTRR